MYETLTDAAGFAPVPYRLSNPPTPMPRLLLVLSLLTLLAACRNDAPTPGPDGEPPEARIPFHVDGTLDFLRESDVLLTIDIEIAATDSARMRGMMQRTSFPDRSGMLFPDDQEKIQQFWMANTPVALDLIFIDADSQIVDFAKYARPFANETIRSAVPAQYVLEVPAGFVDTHGFTETDRVRWREEP